MGKETGLTIGESGSSNLPVFESVVTEMPSLRDLQRSALHDAGFITPRKKYSSKEERKEKARERSREKRAERREFLASKGLVRPKHPKLSREDKRAKNKLARRARNQWLREHPEEAKRAGFDVTRLRVF
jgi:hypothetical protein